MFPLWGWNKLTISSAKWIHSTSQHFISWICILELSHLPLLFRFWDWNFDCSFESIMRAICPAYVSLDLITAVMSGEEFKLWSFYLRSFLRTSRFIVSFQPKCSSKFLVLKTSICVLSLISHRPSVLPIKLTEKVTY